MRLEPRLKSHYESLSRAIGFTSAADNKAPPVLALQVALAGTLAARMAGLWVILSEPPLGAERIAVAALLGLYVTLLIASMAFAASVYIPRNPRTGRSLIYFEDVAAMPPDEFEERSRQLDADAMERQLIDQVYAVSGIASTKMHRVRWAYFTGGPSVVLWVLLLARGSVQLPGKSSPFEVVGA